MACDKGFDLALLAQLDNRSVTIRLGDPSTTQREVFSRRLVMHGKTLRAIDGEGFVQIADFDGDDHIAMPQFALSTEADEFDGRVTRSREKGAGDAQFGDRGDNRIAAEQIAIESDSCFYIINEYSNMIEFIHTVSYLDARPAAR